MHTFSTGLSGITEGGEWFSKLQTMRRETANKQKRSN
jgi:hypothetical protein